MPNSGGNRVRSICSIKLEFNFKNSSMHSCPFSWFCWRKMSDHEQFVASPKENTSDKEQPCAIFRKSQCFISSCFWFINVTLYVHPSGKKVQGSMSGASEAIFFSFKDAKEMDSFTAETSLMVASRDFANVISRFNASSRSPGFSNSRFSIPPFHCWQVTYSAGRELSALT